MADLLPDHSRVVRHEQQLMGLPEETFRLAASGQFEACQVVVHAAEAFDVPHAVPQRSDFGVPLAELVLGKRLGVERDQAVAGASGLIEQHRDDIAGEPVGPLAEGGLCGGVAGVGIGRHQHPEFRVSRLEASQPCLGGADLPGQLGVFLERLDPVHEALAHLVLVCRVVLELLGGLFGVTEHVGGDAVVLDDGGVGDACDGGPVGALGPFEAARLDVRPGRRVREVVPSEVAVGVAGQFQQGVAGRGCLRVLAGLRQFDGRTRLLGYLREASHGLGGAAARCGPLVRQRRRDLLAPHLGEQRHPRREQDHGHLGRQAA